MPSIQVLLGIAAASLAMPCWPQQQSPPWRELTAQAVLNNRELLAAKQRAEEARGLLRQAGLRPAPTLEATGVSGWPLGTRGEEQYGAGIAQTLETGGKRSLRQQVAEKQLALAGIEYDERLRQLRFEIRARYAEFACDVERLAILERMSEAHRQSFELMKARVEQGDAAAIDRDLLLVELNRAQAQRAALTGRIASARADLARLAGLADPQAVPSPLPSPLPDPPPDIEPLKRSAQANRADLRAATMLLDQTAAEAELAKALGRPDVTFSAGYSRVYSRFDDQFGTTTSGAVTPLRDRDDILSVGVSLPIFTRGRNDGNLQAAAARTRGAQHRKQFLELSIPLEVESAWQHASGARQAFRSLDETVLRQSEKNIEVIRRAYQLGQLRLLDVLNEQRRLLDSQLTAIDLKLDLLRAFAELERASGAELP